MIILAAFCRFFAIFADEHLKLRIMETKRLKRSIIYARVSTVIQETDRQVVDLLAYAAMV